MSSESELIDVEIIENNDVEMQFEEYKENNDVKSENVKDDDDKQVDGVEVLDLQENMETQEDMQNQKVQTPISNEPEFLQEDEVSLVDSPAREKMTTVNLDDSETTSPQIMETDGNNLEHNKSIDNKNVYQLNVMNSQSDCVLEMTNDSQNGTGNSKEPLNNSQASTKVNFLDLSDKENENDTPIKEASNLVKSSSIESILSSRSSSPVYGENDDQSGDTVRLDNSSVDESSKQRKSSKFRDILTIYPPPPEKGGISININDYRCLGNNEFLNDVIIDFYLSYLMREVLSPEDKERTHLFSSHFYTRFTKPYDNANSFEFANENDKRHAGVQRWTKNVDIFEKDFIVVPVNEHAHWYLVIICFPHLVGNDDDEPFTYYENPFTEEVQRPCILIFDSLYSNKSTVVTKLRGYLSSEYFVKKGVKKSFVASQLNLVRPKIPKQSNATDCGLFLLQYVENFFKVPIKDFSSPFKSLSNWFTIEEVNEKREKIAKLIQKLSLDFHKGRSIDFPNLSFQKKKRAKCISTTHSEDIEMINIEPKITAKIIPRIIDSDSEEEQVVLPIRIEISNQPLAEKNKSSWRDIQNNFTAKQNSPINQNAFKKTVPHYYNSSKSPINDKPSFSLKNKTPELGSPPYFLPSQTTGTTGIKKFKTLYTNLSKTEDLDEKSESSIRVLMTPEHMQSRSQKMLKASLQNIKSSKFFNGNSTPTVALPNRSDNFYSIQISDPEDITTTKSQFDCAGTCDSHCSSPGSIHITRSMKIDVPSEAPICRKSGETQIKMLIVPDSGGQKLIIIQMPEDNVSCTVEHLLTMTKTQLHEEEIDSTYLVKDPVHNVRYVVFVRAKSNSDTHDESASQLSSNTSTNESSSSSSKSPRKRKRNSSESSYAYSTKSNK